MHLLIRAGANPNLADRSGWTALMYAAREDYAPTVTQLIQAGADLNAQDTHNKTALMIAIQYGRFGNVQALLQAGANPHLQDWFWQTALDYAQTYDQAHNRPNNMVHLLQNPIAANPAIEQANPVAVNEPSRREPIQVTTSSNWSIPKYLLSIGAVGGLTYFIYDTYFKETNVPNKKPIKNKKQIKKQRLNPGQRLMAKINNLSMKTKVISALSGMAVGTCAYFAFKKTSGQQPLQHPMQNIGVQIQEPVADSEPQPQPEVEVLQPAQQIENQDAQRYDYQDAIHNYYGIDGSEDSSTDDDNASIWNSLYDGIANVFGQDDVVHDAQSEQPQVVAQLQPVQNDAVIQIDQLPEDNNQELVFNEELQPEITQANSHNDDVVILIDE